MFEYSNIISTRVLVDEDLRLFSLKDHVATNNKLPEFSMVKAGDVVMQITPYRFSPEVADIFADKDGYIRYDKDGGPAQKKVGDVLFYIVDNADINPDHWDTSLLRIEKEFIDGKYYYSLLGVPKKPVVDIGKVTCMISVQDDNPDWIVECSIYVGHGVPWAHTIRHTVSIEERFRVKLKNGNRHRNGLWYITTNNWSEEDKDHYQIRYFAIGYPAKNHSNECVLLNKSDLKDDACFVYVMRNNSNGAYKIGISKDPRYREHTLQSQEPDVTCIFQLEFDTREIALNIEREMHIKYSQYHIRGEWFVIPHEMIGQVVSDITKKKQQM